MSFRGFAYVRRRNQGSQDLFLIGRDGAAVGELTKRLAEWKEPVGEGLAFSID